MKPVAVLLLAALLALPLVGCDENLDAQNRMKTYGEAAGLRHWPAAGEAVPLVPGTVSQADLEREREVSEPPPVTLALLQQGRTGYDNYCAPCHGLTGAGNGIIVMRGFPKPAPLDDPPLMQAPASDLVDVIGRGYRRMFSFADRVEPRERWAIVAYIRALQLADLHKAKPQ